MRRFDSDPRLQPLSALKSPEMVTRRFENEKGVLIVERQTKKRNYRPIRIPRAVCERVVRKLTVA
jgi:hypothetical protein